MAALAPPHQPAYRQAGQITNEALRRVLRQVALFAAILISGGLLPIPRIPLLAVVLVLCFSLKSPLRLFKAEFLGIWVLLLLVAAAALVGGDNLQVQPMIVRYANFAAGLALLLLYIDERRSTLVDDLYWILKLMAFQAVLTPVIVILLADYQSTFVVNDSTYYTVGYVFTYHDLSGSNALLKRPDGFFFEPGVFQFYLNLFLLIVLFMRKQRLFDIALAALAVIATQSTTGVIILALQFAIAYFVWLRTANRSQKLGVFVFVPIMLLPLEAYMTYNVTEKFYGTLSGSAEAREYDLRTGINVALEQPLTGIGFDYEKYYVVASKVGYREAELSRENITERGNTNGIVVLFYSLGIPLAIIFLLGIFRQRLFKPGLLMAAIAILSLISESLSFTPVFLMLAFSGLLIQSRRVNSLLGGQRSAVGAPVGKRS